MKENWKHIIGLLILCLLFGSCDKKEKTSGNQTYTCPMHPQIVKDDPGSCPICGMDLVPVTKTKGKTNTASIMLSEQQIILGNIKVDTIRLGTIGEEVLLTATTVTNPNANIQISSRIDGRIERLFVRNPGQLIRRGQHLYDIYSEELLATQSEYLLAKESAAKFPSGRTDFKSRMEAARTKMLLWGMTESQINSLNKSTIKATISVYSKESGTVTEINVTEGSYVMTGTPIVKLIDLSSVWIEAQAYPNETRYLKIGQTVEVQSPGIAGRTKGRIVFINPELERNTRLNIIRVEIPNPTLTYQPGMQAYVVLRAAVKQTIIVPSDAVLQDEEGALVWLKTDTGTFERRMVHIGVQNNNLTEIELGLKEGDAVVVSGAYLINSEYLLKTGADDPHAGMEM